MVILDILIKYELLFGLALVNWKTKPVVIKLKPYAIQW